MMNPEASLSLAEGIATTRSIRRYADVPVTEEQLATALFLATRAPSGSNRQPVRLVVLRDGPVATEVRELLGTGARALWAEKAARDEFGRPEPTSRAGRMLATMEHYTQHLADAPVIVLPCMVRYRAPEVSEGASVYPAVQNLLLGARAVGLGGALSMFHKVHEAEIGRLLGLPDTAFIAATVTLGVPAGSHGPVRRKPLGQVVYEDQWGNEADWAVDPEGTRFTGGPRNA